MPTKDQLLKDMLLYNFTYYGTQLSEAMVKMFATELADLEIEDLQRAFAEFRREKGRRQMPMPADIRWKIKPDVCSDRALATEAAARILTAISKFGHPNGIHAKEYIGQLGWSVVTMQGGWIELCRSVGDDVPTSVAQSQWIRLAESLLEMGRALTRDESGKSKAITQVSSIGDVLKKYLPELGSKPPEDQL